MRIDVYLVTEVDLSPVDVHREPRQGYTMPGAVVHRTRAPAGRAAIPMVEAAGVAPAGD